MLSLSSLSIGTVVQTYISIVAGIIIGLLGGWDTGLQTLLIFMLFDIITGMYVALIGRSHNSENGFYKSGVFAKGIFKKILVLIIVSLAYGIDMVINTDCLRDITIMFFIINEAISIIENAQCAGVPVPKKLCVMLEVYHEQCGGSADDDKINYKEFLQTNITPRQRLRKSSKKTEESLRFKKEKP